MFEVWCFLIRLREFYLAFVATLRSGFCALFNYLISISRSVFSKQSKSNLFSFGSLIKSLELISGSFRRISNRFSDMSTVIQSLPKEEKVFQKYPPYIICPFTKIAKGVPQQIDGVISFNLIIAVESRIIEWWSWINPIVSWNLNVSVFVR